MQVLLLCPLKIEFKFLVKAFEAQNLTVKPAGHISVHMPLAARPVDVRRLHIENVDHKIFIASGGHGKVRFGISATMILHAMAQSSQLEKPAKGSSSTLANEILLLTVGACGSLDPEIAPGSLFVPTSIIEHDYHQKFSQESAPTYPIQWPFPWPTGTANINFHSGVLASGDEDIIEKTRARQLAEQTGAQAVAWESAGGARAARMLGVGYGELRCVTDNPALTTAEHAGANVAQQFRTNLETGMKLVAQALGQVFTSPSI